MDLARLVTAAAVSLAAALVPAVAGDLDPVLGRAIFKRMWVAGGASTRSADGLGPPLQRPLLHRLPPRCRSLPDPGAGRRFARRRRAHRAPLQRGGRSRSGLWPPDRAAGAGRSGRGGEDGLQPRAARRGRARSAHGRHPLRVRLRATRAGHRIRRAGRPVAARPGGARPHRRGGGLRRSPIPTTPTATASRAANSGSTTARGARCSAAMDGGRATPPWRARSPARSRSISASRRRFIRTRRGLHAGAEGLPRRPPWRPGRHDRDRGDGRDARHAGSLSRQHQGASARRRRRTGPCGLRRDRLRRLPRAGDAGGRRRHGAGLHRPPPARSRPGLADPAVEGVATAAEWRTAPLVGLGDVRPGARRFLHDGRAGSIDEAIRWHGGEASAAKMRYEDLSAADRAALVAYLKGL